LIQRLCTDGSRCGSPLHVLREAEELARLGVIAILVQGCRCQIDCCLYIAMRIKKKSRVVGCITATQAKLGYALFLENLHRIGILSSLEHVQEL
jgi:hypothetical protein